MYKRVYTFLHAHAILYQSQYGFRSGRSTIHAIGEFVGNVLDGFNENMCTIAVFIDLRKAFDSVH